MRVIVCGGRDYADINHVFKALDAFDGECRIDLVIHGKAPGADMLAESWAKYRRRDCLAYPANWAKHGKAAGPRRNQKMLDEGQPEAVLAFPGGAGTADMIRRAEAAGVPVYRL